MKISENFSIYAGGDNGVVNTLGQQDKKEGSSIFAGDLTQNFMEDPIAKRREQAQKEALKVVSDAFEGDLSIDKDIEDGYERIKKLQSGMHEAEVRMQEIDEQQKMLIEEQGYAPDHPELADLAEEKKELQKEYNNCHSEMKGEIAAIKAVKLERLKHSPMLDAEKEAEAIMEEASEEIVGMLFEEGKEHLDEEQKLREEQAEKIEKEKEEQEAFIEAQKEKKEAAEELTEEMPMEEMLTLEQAKTDVQKEVQNIVDKMKLVAEDMKGAVVDKSV